MLLTTFGDAKIADLGLHGVQVLSLPLDCIPPAVPALLDNVLPSIAGTPAGCSKQHVIL